VVTSESDRQVFELRISEFPVFFQESLQLGSVEISWLREHSSHDMTRVRMFVRRRLRSGLARIEAPYGLVGPRPSLAAAAVLALELRTQRRGAADGGETDCHNTSVFAKPNLQARDVRKWIVIRPKAALATGLDLRRIAENRAQLVVGDCPLQPL
jgi:hypothetical protein